MNNIDFIFENQNQYDSLKFLSIKDNKLILNKDGIFMIPFSNVQLTNLNPNIFLLDPKELFHTLYMLELLPKNDINQNEEIFIKSYTERYLKLNDRALQESDINQDFVTYIGTPITLSYDPLYENLPCSKIIKNILDTHNNELENGRSNQKKLILIPNQNPNFIQELPEDNIRNFEKAGFSTLLLIGSAVALTCIYIAYFIIGR